MANSYVTYSGDGNQQDFTVTFPYIKRDDVTVTLDTVATTAYTWQSDTLIRMSSAPSAGVVLKIARSTTLDSKVVDFMNGAGIAEEDLDNCANQMLFLIQEFIEGRGVVGGGGGDMSKSTYDANDDGIVDNAAKVNGVNTAGNSKYYGTNAAGAVGFHDLGSGGLTEIVQDTTPQLGGDLDMNTHKIQGVSAAEMAYLVGVTSAIQTQLNGKAATAHTHDDRYYTEAETDTLLSGKAAVSHTQAISSVTGLQTALDGKAASSHTHAISDTTGLQTALDGKASTSHNQAISTITGLQTALDGKAASSHTHAESDVAGLTTDLAAKVAGPASSTDNALVRFDGTGGKTAQDSLVTVDDSGSVNIPTGQTYKINGAAHTHAHADLTSIPDANHREILYGTGTPPSASGHNDGTLYFKHSA
jgi:hypothetical protein